MKQIIRLVLTGVVLLLVILFLAAIPTMLQSQYGEVRWVPLNGLHFIKLYVTGVKNGYTFHYQQGLDRHPSFLKDVWRYMRSSYLYLLLSGAISLILGILLGFVLSQSKRSWLKDLIGFLGFIPDFILVLLLQLGTVALYKSTGLRINASTTATGSPAILLPIISLSLVPTIYLIRTTSEQVFTITTQDYILLAKSKGLHKLGIYTNHVFRNVMPFLKADLHKLVAIMISNLFIVEFLFNTRGLTTLMFTGQAYQYNLTVNTLICFVCLYGLLYLSLRTLLYGLGARLIND